MTKKAQSEQSSSPDISFSEHFDVLNEKIDSNTKSIKSLKKQISLILTKVDSIEQLIRQSFTENTSKRDQNQPLSNNSSNLSQDSDRDSFEKNEKPAKTQQPKTIKPSERVIKTVKHSSDSEQEEDIKDQNNLETTKTTKQEKSNIKTVKNQPTQNKTIIKPNTSKVTKSNNPPTGNTNHPIPRPKTQIIKSNKETSSEEEDQKGEEIDIQDEFSKSLKKINIMQRSISKSIDYVNQTLICENLNAMKCFKKINWNTKKSEDDENLIKPLTKNGCKYHIYAVDHKNKKYYFEITNSTISNNELVKKIDQENESFVLARVSNSLKSPIINYYLFINKDFYKIKCYKNQSITKTIYEMKVQNKVIKNKGIDYDYDEETKDDDDEEENEEEEDKVKNGKLNEKQISKSIKIRTKKDGKYTNSTILRKIKFIRNENDDDDNDVDFQNELTKSRLRINNMENCVSFNIGYMGEAYVFEDLKAMKCFSKVVWNAKTSNPKSPSIFIRNGKQYHIDEDGGHYDIYAFDKNNKKYYFEIKSSSSSKKSSQLSNEQEKLSRKINQNNESFIKCTVTKVLDSPQISYELVIKKRKYKIITSKTKSFVEAIDEIKIQNKCYTREENHSSDDDFDDSSEEGSDKKTEIDDDDDIDDDFYYMSAKNIKYFT